MNTHSMPEEAITRSPLVQPAARVALVASGIALAALALLHVVSPEFDPSWRMVSEYANGRHRWLLTLFFASWAVGTWALALALWPSTSSRVARAGVVLMCLSGVGEALGALFDVNHPGHGLAFALGVPSWPVAVLLAGVPLARRDGSRVIGWLSQAPWFALMLMGASFALLASSAAKVGVVLEPGKPWHEIPAGVTAVMGWANRLLVVAYVAWTIAVARHLARKAEPRPTPPSSRCLNCSNGA